jgi:hypothetical protein
VTGHWPGELAERQLFDSMAGRKQHIADRSIITENGCSSAEADLANQNNNVRDRDSIPVDLSFRYG